MGTAHNAEREPGAAARARREERGAALMTALMLSMLLLVVVGALVASTGLSAVNAADSTPELQTYYAAESGLHGALRVLRGNVAPNPLFVSPVGNPVHEENRLSFRDAVTRSRSNLTTDPTTYPSGGAFPFRLSRWLSYDYTPPGGTYADRVTLTPGYAPATGLAYSVTVEDVDNSQVITYSTAGSFSNGSCSGGVCSVTIMSPTVPGDRVTVSYTPQASTTVNATAPVSGGVGRFSVSRTGAGKVVIPANVQFQLVLDLAKPWPTRLIVSATLSGEIDGTTSSLMLTFSNDSAVVGGTNFTFASSQLRLNNGGSFSAGPYPLNATITAPEPRRLRVTSTGYGPGGARKVLEMIVNRFNYLLEPPSPLVIRGSDDTSQTMTFNLGDSAAKYYTGKDAAGIQAQVPTIAIRLHDWTKGYDGVTKGSTVDDPKFSILDLNPVPNPWPVTLTPVPSSAPGSTVSVPQSAITPDILRHADEARTFLNEMEKYARENGRYFASLSGTAGTTAKPELTFVDGNCVLEGGRGLLIVTGNLELKGNNDFQGIVMVLGNGHVTRSGAGNGRVLGGWYVAKFTRPRPAGCAQGCTPGTSGCAFSCGFAAPYFDVSGGGVGRFQYDWREITGANVLLGSRVHGIDEK